MSLTPHHFCMSSARKQNKKNKKNPSSFFIRTSLEMTKSLGVHSESEEFDTWRNKERRGSVLFLKERRLAAAADGGNVQINSTAAQRNNN